MTNIHKHIKSYRIKCNMTQEQLAEKIFTTRQTISSYETGRTTPSIEVLQLIAEAFELSVEELIYGNATNKKRNRVNKAAFICLAIFLIAVFLSSGMLCLLNRHLPIKDGTQVTEQIMEVVKLRFAILDFQYVVASFAKAFGTISAVALLCFDVATKPSVKLTKKALFGLLSVVCPIIVSLPWSLFDPIYNTADYILISLTSIVLFLIIFIIDICISCKYKIVKAFNAKSGK